MPLKNKTERKEYNKEYHKKWYSNSKNKQKVLDANKVNKAKYLQEFRTLKSTLQCEICKESDSRCLDFHHTDPKTKEKSINEMVRNMTPIEKIQEEIKKCSVLCANCHRKVHINY